MRSKSFIKEWDYRVPKQSLYNYTDLYSCIYHREENKGYNAVLIHNIVSGNTEIFELIGDYAYHLNQYLTQRNTSHEECNSHYTNYPRVSRVPQDDDIIRENSVHAMIFYSFCKEEWKAKHFCYSYVMNQMGYTIDHKNDDRYCNKPGNLQLLTLEENQAKRDKTDLNRHFYKVNEARWLREEEDFSFLNNAGE